MNSSITSITNPILHDQSNVLNMGDPRNPPLVERKVGYRDSAYGRAQLLSTKRGQK